MARNENGLFLVIVTCLRKLVHLKPLPRLEQLQGDWLPSQSAWSLLPLREIEQTESKASSMSLVSEIISFIERNPITRNVPFSIPGNPTKATSSTSH
jgi:hypothetical protein